MSCCSGFCVSQKPLRPVHANMNVTSVQEATPDTLAKNTMLTSPFQVKLYRRVFSAPGPHHGWPPQWWVTWDWALLSFCKVTQLARTDITHFASHAPKPRIGETIKKKKRFGWVFYYFLLCSFTVGDELQDNSRPDLFRMRLTRKLIYRQRKESVAPLSLQGLSASTHKKENKPLHETR